MDAEQLDRFVTEDYQRVVAAVTVVCGSVALAEDAVQEAVARALERDRGIRNLAAWVTTVACNETRTRFRRAGRERRALERLAATEGAAPTGLELVDELLVVHQAVARLPRRQRQAVVLRYFLGLDMDTIATEMRIAPGTVKALLHQGRRSLSSDLEPRPSAPPATSPPRRSSSLSAVVEVRP